MALSQLFAEPGAGDGDVADALFVQPVHHPALQLRGRVVQVHDRILGPGDGLIGPLDQLGSALREHLDPDVVGYQVLLHEHTAELEVGRRGRREPHLDLLEPHLDEHLEHLALARHVHRVDEGLVAVTQVYRAPQRRLGDDLVGPGAVRQMRGKGVGVIEPVRHRARLLGADALDVCHGSLLRLGRSFGGSGESDR